MYEHYIYFVINLSTKTYFVDLNASTKCYIMTLFSEQSVAPIPSHLSLKLQQQGSCHVDVLTSTSSHFPSSYTKKRKTTSEKSRVLAAIGCAGHILLPLFSYRAATPPPISHSLHYLN